MSEPRTEYLDDKGRYAQRMFDELVASIAAKYDLQEWTRRCREKKLHPDLQVQFDEEAGRLEFECDVPRMRAEEMAAQTVFAKHNIL